MAELHARYDRRADVLYLTTDRNASATAREDDQGIVWRYLDDTDEPIGATIIDFHELWGDRLDDLAGELSRHLRVPAYRAAAALKGINA